MTRLFFYGTLMSREGRGGVVPREAVASIRPATIEGELHDVGWFPAYVPGSGRVVGEVWEIRPEWAAHVLAITDGIEGYREGDATSLYVRETVEAEVLVDGMPGYRVEVQTYRWNAHEIRLRGRIVSGDWRNRFSSDVEMPMEAS